MEPLSIASSVIAIGQAGDRITGLLISVGTWIDAPDEVDVLINELADVKLVLSLVQDFERHLRTSDSSPSAEDAVSLAKLLDGCKTIVLDLEKLVAYDLVRDCRFDEAGRRKVHSTRWVAKRNKVMSLRRRLRDQKGLIQLALTNCGLNFQSRLAMTIEGITVIANNLRNQHAEQRWYTDRRLDQQDRILVEILKSTGTTEIILQASRDQDTPSDQISNDNSALVHARPSTPEAAQPLGPLRTSLKLTTSYLGNTSCPNHCSCCCHTRTVLQARSLWNAVLGYLFVGYVGSPISRRDCDSITCRRRSTPAIVVEYFFPSWFLMRAIAISFWNGATPKLSLAFPRVIAPESEIFRYIRLGQCDLLKGLFLQGRASPDDVGATTGLRPLSYAISHNQVDVCQLLISEGADPFASNNNAIADTAADLAWNLVREYSTPGSVRDVLQSIIPAPPDLEQRSFTRLHKIVLGIAYESADDVLRVSRPTINSADSKGWTALHWAAYTGNVDLLNGILRCGANPDIQDRTGRVALHAAGQNGSLGCVKALLAAGANANPKDNWAETPLHLAASYGRNDVIVTLVDAGADANAPSIDSETPLCYATLSNNVEGVLALLRRGANLNGRDRHGYTVLLDSIWANSHDVLELLLAEGARYDIAGHDGKTILHAAAQYGDIRTMEILQSAQMVGIETSSLNSDGHTAMAKLKHRGAGGDLTEAFGALLVSIKTIAGSPIGIANLSVENKYIESSGSEDEGEDFFDAVEYQI